MVKGSEKVLKSSKKKAEGKVTPQGHRNYQILYFQCQT